MCQGVCFKPSFTRSLRNVRSIDSMSAHATSDLLQKKLTLAFRGHSDPIIGLAVEFFAMREWDLKSPKTRATARRAVRHAAEYVRKFAAEALMNWKPEVFDKLALAMRKVARGGDFRIRNIETD